MLNLESVLTALIAWCFFKENADRRIVIGMASIKGLVAGQVNTAIALFPGHRLPEITQLAPVLLVGCLGYGISLVAFVLALRGLGSARTGAYFSTAPFLGAAWCLLAFGESVGRLGLLGAAGLMSVGVWLHLTERHAHRHGPVRHSHLHYPEIHHRHVHSGSGQMPALPSSAAHR